MLQKGACGFPMTFIVTILPFIGNLIINILLSNTYIYYRCLFSENGMSLYKKFHQINKEINYSHASCPLFYLFIPKVMFPQQSVRSLLM